MYIELHLRNIKLSRLITSGIITLAIVLYVFNTSIQDAVYVLLLIPVFILLTLFRRSTRRVCNFIYILVSHLLREELLVSILIFSCFTTWFSNTI
jgi:hypothetical protein